MADENKTVSSILERFTESRKHMQDLWGEIQEVYRAIKCRTLPIYKLDESGKPTNQEDKSQTNVAMPDLNLIYRRNVSRMTAQPYRLNYTGGKDPLVTQALSALHLQQYERSKEPMQDVRVTMSGEAFGFGYSKLDWDVIERTMQFRQALMKGEQVIYRDRANIMQHQGAPQEEIDGAVAEYGPEMNDDEISAFMGKSGLEITVPTLVRRYEGPVLRGLFPGDLLLEPECDSGEESGFYIEKLRPTDLWLVKKSKETYVHPDTKQKLPVFDKDAVQELFDSAETSKADDLEDLRRMFEDAAGRSDKQAFPARLRGRKKFDILEYHTLEDDGRMWVYWVSDRVRTKPLGCRPYPWDLYGQSVYSEYIPLPDFASPFGDSTPRLLRHLYNMHNRTVAQNFDYVTNLLQRYVKVKDSAEIEFINRGKFRELRVSDMNAVDVMQEPSLPVGAFEREAQILRMMATAEPSMNTVDTGSASNPMAGKLATTAMLNAKASDALTQFKIEGRNRYLRDIGQKKLWMNQQAAQEAWEVDSKYWPEELAKRVQEMDPLALAEVAIGFNPEVDNPQEWALSSRHGQTAAIRLDPLEIQEDLQVEPEPGSYLAVDDDIRRQAAMELEQVAQVAPDILDRRKVARFHLSTIRSIGNPDDYIVPEQPPNPAADVKKSLSVNMPLDKMPADVTNQALEFLGFQPSADLAAKDTLEGVVTMNEAAQAAVDLQAPAASTQEKEAAQMQQKQNKPPKK
jgi:hypothetical protein